MWWHYKGNTFLETSFLPLPSVINVISIFFLTLFIPLLRLLKRLQIYITLLFVSSSSLNFFFLFLNRFSFLTSAPSNPKEATQWKNILHLAQKFIFCLEWRNFSRNADIGRILEWNRIVGLPIPWFKNLDRSKNWRRKRFKIFEFRPRLNRDDVIINVIVI